jgi:hypothetical protein
MKTITTYSLLEFSPKRQERILDAHCFEAMRYRMAIERKKYEDILGNFCFYTNVHLSNYWCDYSGHDFDIEVTKRLVWTKRIRRGIWQDNYLPHLSGKMLARYLVRDLLPHFYASKRYYTPPYNNPRTSNIIVQMKCGAHEEIYAKALAPIYDYLRHPDDTTTYRSLMRRCVDGIFDVWESEFVNSSTRPLVRETILDADWQFYANIYRT